MKDSLRLKVQAILAITIILLWTVILFPSLNNRNLESSEKGIGLPRVQIDFKQRIYTKWNNKILSLSGFRMRLLRQSPCFSKIVKIGALKIASQCLEG